MKHVKRTFPASHSSSRSIQQRVELFVKKTTDELEADNEYISLLQDTSHYNQSIVSFGYV